MKKFRPFPRQDRGGLNASIRKWEWIVEALEKHTDNPRVMETIDCRAHNNCGMCYKYNDSCVECPVDEKLICNGSDEIIERGLSDMVEINTRVGHYKPALNHSKRILRHLQKLKKEGKK